MRSFVSSPNPVQKTPKILVSNDSGSASQILPPKKEPADISGNVHGTFADSEDISRNIGSGERPLLGIMLLLECQAS